MTEQHQVGEIFVNEDGEQVIVRYEQSQGGTVSERLHALGGRLLVLGSTWPPDEQLWLPVLSELLSRQPDLRVVLVRQTGLWGSSFGWAEGREPDVARALRQGVGGMLASGVLLTPRRPVQVELVEPADAEDPEILSFGGVDTPEVPPVELADSEG